MLKILQISDPHILPLPTDTLLGVDTEYYFQRVLQHAHAEHGSFDLILVSGDLAQDPCPASYHRILQHLQDYKTPALCLPGNHDDADLMQAILSEGTVSCGKQLQLQNWQIIGLNSRKPASPVGVLAPEEMAFLEEALQASPNTPTLIALHHHCIPSGSLWLDTMQIENSAALLDLLDSHPQVKAITFGHVHQEITGNRGRLAIFAAPSTCFQFTPHSSEFSIDNTSPGYRVFQLYDDGILQSACYRIPESLQGLSIDAHGY